MTECQAMSEYEPLTEEQESLAAGKDPHICVTTEK